MGDVVARHGVRRERVPELMEALGLPETLLARRPGQVSGGELQRLAIVRAMVVSPTLVFADEATSRLDLLTQQVTIDALLAALAETDSALLLVTHDRDLAAAVCDHGLDLGRQARAAEPELAGV
jgi:peptide/nickel transport system ATP-binding protein